MGPAHPLAGDAKGKAALATSLQQTPGKRQGPAFWPRVLTTPAPLPHSPKRLFLVQFRFGSRPGSFSFPSFCKGSPGSSSFCSVVSVFAPEANLSGLSDPPPCGCARASRRLPALHLLSLPGPAPVFRWQPRSASPRGAMELRSSALPPIAAWGPALTVEPAALSPSPMFSSPPRPPVTRGHWGSALSLAVTRLGLQS